MSRYHRSRCNNKIWDTWGRNWNNIIEDDEIADWRRQGGGFVLHYLVWNTLGTWSLPWTQSPSLLYQFFSSPMEANLGFLTSPSLMCKVQMPLGHNPNAEGFFTCFGCLKGLIWSSHHDSSRRISQQIAHSDSRGKHHHARYVVATCL